MNAFIHSFIIKVYSNLHGYIPPLNWSATLYIHINRSTTNEHLCPIRMHRHPQSIEDLGAGEDGCSMTDRGPGCWGGWLRGCSMADQGPGCGGGWLVHDC